ncbi:MAG: ABC transporter permease [Candidatus Micrarchaeota archaeon]|nr:ABC transporter permease [Candidatus Micrarchaeota archaeon]
MRLIAEIDKDIRLFYREGRTVTLLFVVPVILMLVLSGVFGKTTGDPTLNMNIGFCDLDKTNFSKSFISGIENSKILDISEQENCSILAHELVSTGKLGAAVLISPGFEKGIKNGDVQEIKLIIDNTRVQTAPSIEGFFRAAAQSSSQKISVEYVSVIWEKLEEADKKLDGFTTEINETNGKAKEINGKLNQTRQQLEEIDFSIMTNALNDANFTIDKATNSLQSANDNLTEIEKKFNSYDETLRQSENDLLNISIVVDDLASRTSAISKQFNCNGSSNQSICSSLNEINSSIGIVKSNVDNRLLKIRIAREDLSDTNITVQEFKLKINESLSSADLAQTKINGLNKFVATLEGNRNNALSTLSEAEYATQTLLKKTEEMSSIIKDTRKQIKEITSREPLAVVSPIKLNSEEVFEKKTFFEFLLPGLVPIIMMFLSLFLSSTSLVREKVSGTLERVFISQISSVEYAATKIISYAIVLFPQLVILLLMSSFLYGAFSIENLETTSYLILVGLLMMMVFNAMGFIIAAYSDSEVTAFLASLVIGLPLLFMSGLIFPFDFMPSFMAQIGQANPLSQGIIGMQSVITYGTPDQSIISTLVYYVIILNMAAIVFIYLKIKD